MWLSLNLNVKKIVKSNFIWKARKSIILHDVIKLIIKHQFINMSKIDLDGGMLE